MSKVEEFIAETKLNDLLHKKEAESQKNKVIWVLAIIGAVADSCRNRLRSVSFLYTGLFGRV